MLQKGETILVGLSGGPDSVCLLHLLNSIREDFKLNINAIYIDHGLRPEETPFEIRFCEDFCKTTGNNLIVRAINVRDFAEKEKLNLQEAGRYLRYMTYNEVAKEIKATRIALGHTADDQAETLLMRLIRGSGTTGLASIPPVRGNIIRPLIETERKEIIDYLEDMKVDYVVDSSNLKRNYLRNKIRLSLIPILSEINPDIIQTLSKTAAIFRDEERYFEIIVTKTLMKLFSRKTDKRVELFLAPFEVMDTVIMRRVLRRVIDETRGLRGINFFHIEDIIELIKNGKPGDRIYLPRGIRVIKEYSVLILTSEPPVKLGQYTLDVPSECVLKEAKLVIKSSILDSKEQVKITPNLWKSYAYFDVGKLRFPLIIRARKDGDYFYPYGFGKRKKLQDYFVDEKVPRDDRDRVPLIISGDDIIWVVGYRGDDRYKITDSTTKILYLEAKVTRD